MPNVGPDTLMRRKAVAEALTIRGFPISRGSLAMYACKGGGPPFRLFGRIPLYRFSDALKWAEARTSGLLYRNNDSNTGEAAQP